MLKLLHHVKLERSHDSHGVQRSKELEYSSQRLLDMTIRNWNKKETQAGKNIG